jgi:arylsulfatase A-like enzyme
MYDPDKLRLRQNCKIVPLTSLDPAWSHRPTTADYYALITALDEQMGRLLAHLDAAGLSDDTLVVFTSDHGDMMWSQGLLYKCVPYEESVNVPLVMRWPGGLPRGFACDTLTGTVDMFPTLAKLLGWPVPPSVQGIDVSAGWSNRPGAAQPASVFLSNYTHYVFREDQPTPPWRGVRTPRYTYAATHDRRAWKLFDNERDPYQMANLAGVAEFRGVEMEMAAELERWLKRVGDPFLAQEETMTRFGNPYNWPEEKA